MSAALLIEFLQVTDYDPGWHIKTQVFGTVLC